MIYTLKIRHLFGGYGDVEWESVIEIASSSTLEDLHEAIQMAVEFENDHMYEFYVSRTPTSRDKVRFDDENGEIFEKTVADVFPVGAGKKLFYLFDYGDNWQFQVSLARSKPRQPQPGVSYPRVISETGRRPIQYRDYEEED